MTLMAGRIILAAQPIEGVEQFIDTALHISLPPLKGVSVAIILWGIGCAVVRLVGMEFKRLGGTAYRREAARIRQHLGYYLLLGLEFLIAVDVIETLLSPDWKELGLLAGLVVLRTMMSFSLHWELKETETDSAT